MFEFVFVKYRIISGRVKGAFLSTLFGRSFSFVGRNLKYVGIKYINQEAPLSVGDNTWIEAVCKYREASFKPSLSFGSKVMLSNNVHISCVHSIIIDDGVLIGSNVYVGDHSHGSLAHGKIDIAIPPYKRNLDDITGIYIGKNTWIGDGAVILAGSYICDGCVVGANAVVKGEFRVPCVIAGVPAKAVKLLS
ncbi:TPA: DapH/DapD/GlmU-related protein [Aeromonas veronii]